MVAEKKFYFSETKDGKILKISKDPIAVKTKSLNTSTASAGDEAINTSAVSAISAADVDADDGSEAGSDNDAGDD